MPDLPSIDVQAVLDGTIVVGDNKSGFYQANDDKSEGHLNGEATVVFHPIKDLTITGNVGVGNNYRLTQPIGGQHDAPIDVLQVCAEYHRGLLYLKAGRCAETMGVETISPAQRDFTLVSPNFLMVPFTETGVAIGLMDDETKLSFGVSRGPDRLLNGDNNKAAWLYANLNKVIGAKWTVFSNVQGGPDQKGDADHWRLNFDTGVTYNPTDEVQLIGYGLFSTEEFIEGGWQHAGGVNVYARFHPSHGSISYVGRIGLTHDDGARLGALTDLAQFSGGLNIDATDKLKIKIQGDALKGESLLLRGTVQFLYVYNR